MRVVVCGPALRTMPWKTVESVLDALRIDWTKCARWSDFERALPQAAAGLLLLDPSDSEAIRRVGTLSKVGSTRVVVLAPANLRMPTDSVILRVVNTPNAVLHRMPGALFEARILTLLHRLTDEVGKGRSHSVKKWYIHVALLVEPPVTSVTAWAARCDRSPQSLRYRWSAETSNGTPKEFLQWLLLVRRVRPSGTGRVASDRGASGGVLIGPRAGLVACGAGGTLTGVWDGAAGVDAPGLGRGWGVRVGKWAARAPEAPVRASNTPRGG